MPRFSRCSGADRRAGALCRPWYPHDNEHGLSPARLVKEGVAFFIIRLDGEPAGCGGLKLYGTEYGEIMRMYVRPPFRGRGLGRQMLRHLEGYALGHGVEMLRLKTGIFQPEALGLYERSGYREILAFGSYREHPLNMLVRRVPYLIYFSIDHIGI